MMFAKGLIIVVNAASASGLGAGVGGKFLGRQVSRGGVVLRGDISAGTRDCDTVGVGFICLGEVLLY